MAAVGEGSLGLLAQALPDRGKPSPGALPGVVVAVELIRSERPVVIGQRDIGGAHCRQQVSVRGERKIAVVAIGLKSGRKVAGESKLFGHRFSGESEHAPLLIDAEVTGRGAQPKLGCLRRAGDEIDHTADGIGSIAGGTGTLQNFDLFNRLHRDRDVEIVMARLCVVETQSIQQDQRLAKTAAPDA